MEIDKEDAVDRAQYEGKTYYFCSEACKERFELDPESYAKAESKGR
jgi:Cu+-exporting ATPase